MKEIDRRTIKEYGIPSLVLMERAALEVVNEAEKILVSKFGTVKCSVWVACGLGNNGADGVAAARMLFLRGAKVTIILPEHGGRMSPEMKIQLSIVEKLGIQVYSVDEFVPTSCDLILDAVFGIGLARPVEGNYKKLLELILAQEDIAVISVDIPSGISSETGEVMGCAICADVTVTFGERKLGQTLFPGRDYCGRLVIADIGFVPHTPEMMDSYVCAHTKEDLHRIPRRRSTSHKGSCGKVLMIAGSKNMAGAACFAARAAYRTGAGLVKVMTVEENRSILQEKIPEAILSVYDSQWAESHPVEFREEIRQQTEWADVIVLGPGLGMEPYARELVEAVLTDAYVPIIFDADAINLAAKYPHLKGYFTENIILTPHLAECARLTETSIHMIKENLIQTAKELSEEYGVTCVLKDAATVTARKDGKVFVNTSGSPAMAKGGSGDVLCGVIAGLAGMGMEECDAASLGVYVHGLAGEVAARKYGVHSVLASELADCVGEVINETVSSRICENTFGLH